jgi:hypothetical protein
VSVSSLQYNISPSSTKLSTRSSLYIFSGMNWRALRKVSRVWRSLWMQQLPNTYSCFPLATLKLQSNIYLASFWFLPSCLRMYSSTLG